MKLRIMLLSVGGLLLLGLLVSLLGGGLVSLAGNDSWTQEASVNPGDDNHLYGVAAPGSSIAWAVGDWHTQSVSNDYRPLIERWNGTSWANVTPVPIQESGSNFLRGTTAVGSQDGWAVGYATESFTSYEHAWAVHSTDNGANWALASIASSPRGERFYGVGGSSTSDVWGVGSTSSGTVPMIRHWGGSSWSSNYSITNASTGVLYGVAASSSTNAWAVGYEPDGSNIHRVLVAHWDGSSWSQATSSAFSISGSYGDESLRSVTILPNGDVIAVGYYDGGNQLGYQTVAFHYNHLNQTWSQPGTPNPHVGAISSSAWLRSPTATSGLSATREPAPPSIP